ncbi:uncharacterized protein L969DRAFT_17226 [Mixia osmundae IAM 14324]|uniref:uncharacterized protein n=1 Tax=Mixia osmundae (strain CBS 9802 / IAM 14324 / JCM 22182 / KY 12970) TaxID=764103 RepID=UPI0004A5472C|nr:uncharacterized protein L969DRAFT_17226 [Mixia osmundae IAM 14324]KEI39302.1 hypothetical protein L969DRAFT_17226 [Mixia osmundae IAM 14324]
MDELRRIPPVTRTVVGSMLAVTLGSILTIVRPQSIVLYWPWVTRRAQIWRLPSCFCLGPKGLSLIFTTILLYQQSNSLETEHFQGRTADYAFSLVAMQSMILLLSLPFRPAVLFNPMLISIIHYWALGNRAQKVNLYGIVSIPAIALSWAMLGFGVLESGFPGSFPTDFTGMIAAHLWWYAQEHYPRTRRQPPHRRLIPTPGFLIRLLGNGSGTTTTGAGTIFAARGGSGRPAPEEAAAARRGHSWGSGNKLGT